MKSMSQEDIELGAELASSQSNLSPDQVARLSPDQVARHKKLWGSVPRVKNLYSRIVNGLDQENGNYILQSLRTKIVEETC